MIFQYTHEKVLSGQKTQTRRIVKPGETYYHDGTGKIQSVYVNTGGSLPPVYGKPPNNLRLKWQVGRTYAVQPGRGKAAVGRIRITAIRKEKVKDITEEDAFAEGCKRGNVWESAPNELGHTFRFQAKAQFKFKTLWEEVHGPGAWERNDGVWVLEFERVTEAEPA